MQLNNRVTQAPKGLLYYNYDGMRPHAIICSTETSVFAELIH